MSLDATVREFDLAAAMQELIRLKRIKRRIEGGEASPEEIADHDGRKERAWGQAERAMERWLESGRENQ